MSPSKPLIVIALLGEPKPQMAPAPPLRLRGMHPPQPPPVLYRRPPEDAAEGWEYVTGAEYARRAPGGAKRGWESVGGMVPKRHRE